MTDTRKVVYTVELNHAEFQKSADQIVKMYQRSLKRIDVQVVDPASSRLAAREIGRIGAEYKDLEAISRRVNRNAAEMAKNLASARVPAAAGGATAAGGGIGGMLGKVGPGLVSKAVGVAAGGVAGAIAVDAIREQVAGLKELGEEIKASGEQFEFLVGNADKAEAILRAVTNASDGSATRFDAQKLAAAALNSELAKTPKEFDELIRAARGAEQVSPFIDDIAEALDRIEVTASAQSFDGLKFLGVAADDVRERMETLQKANALLTDEQAFAAATVDTLNEKHGQLVNTVEAQASGYDLLMARTRELKEETALLVKEYIDLPAAIDDAFARATLLLGGDLPLLKTQDLIDKAASSRLSTGDNEARLTEASATIDQFIDAQEKLGATNPLIQQYGEELSILTDEIANQRTVTIAQAAELEELSRAIGLAADGGIILAPTMEEVAAAEKLAAEEANAASVALTELLESATASGGGLSTLEAIAISTGSTINTLEGDVAAATSRLAEFNAQLGGINRAESSINSSIISQATNVATIVGDDAARTIAQTALDVVEARFNDIENNLIAGNGPSAIDLAFETASLSDTVLAPFVAIKDEQEAIAQAEKASLREMQRLEKQGLAERQRLEKARINDLNKAVQSTKGLFDKSEVTQEDFDLESLGLREEAADEFRRRLGGVLDGKDLFPELTIDEGVAKARLGLDRIGANQGDGSLEALVTAFDQAWNDSSLFSNLENINEFVNPEAIARQKEQSAKASLGEQNLLERFGIDPSGDLGVGTAIQADIQKSAVDVALQEKITAGIANSQIGMIGEGQQLERLTQLATGEAAAGFEVTPRMIVDTKQIASFTAEVQATFEAQGKQLDIMKPILGSLSSGLRSEATQGLIIRGGLQFWNHFERGVLQGASGSALVDNITATVMANVRESLGDGANAQ